MAEQKPSPTGKNPAPISRSIEKQITELLDNKRARSTPVLLRKRHRRILEGDLGDVATTRVDLLRQPRRDPLLIARGQIIVRERDADRAAAALGDQYRREPLAIGPRRYALFSADVGPEHVLCAIRCLRTHCIESSPNTIAASGMRSKSHVTPELSPVQLTVTGDPEAGAGAHVVVIDTGIHANADARGDKLLTGIVDPDNVDPLTAINVQEGDGDFLDLAAGHGTFVAGVIRTIAPKTKITMIRALDSDGVGSSIEVARAIEKAASLKPHVINMSLGTEEPDHDNSIAIADAVADAAANNPDMVMVAAAGNSYDQLPTWPAALPNVTAVAALTQTNQPTVWSKHGWWIDVSTTGEGIVSTFVPGEELKTADSDPDTWGNKDPIAVWTGTSFAAPRVSAAIAVGVGKGRTPTDALDDLKATGTAIPDWGVAVTV